MRGVVYTHHAMGKFEIFKRHGFEITSDQIEETVSNPDKVISQSNGRFIAQKRITKQHLLRVVYRKEGEKRVVITFYPGRRDRYED